MGILGGEKMKTTKPLDWQYSRNQLCHYVTDGVYYGKDFMCLWEIRELRDMGTFQKYGTHGYTLYHKGRRKAHAFTVKEMKVLEEALNGKVTK